MKKFIKMFLCSLLLVSSVFTTSIHAEEPIIQSSKLSIDDNVFWFNFVGCNDDGLQIWQIELEEKNLFNSIINDEHTLKLSYTIDEETYNEVSINKTIDDGIIILAFLNDDTVGDNAFIITYKGKATPKYFNECIYPELVNNYPFEYAYIEGFEALIVPDFYDEFTNYYEDVQIEEKHFGHNYSLVVSEDDYDGIMNSQPRLVVKPKKTQKEEKIELKKNYFSYFENDGTQYSDCYNYDFTVTKWMPESVAYYDSGLSKVTFANQKIKTISDKGDSVQLEIRVPYEIWSVKEPDLDDFYCEIKSGASISSNSQGFVTYNDWNDKCFVKQISVKYNDKITNFDIVAILDSRSVDVLKPYNNINKATLQDYGYDFELKYAGENDKEFTFSWVATIPYSMIGKEFDLTEAYIDYALADGSSVISINGDIKDTCFDMDDYRYYEYPCSVKTKDKNGKTINHLFRLAYAEGPSEEELLDYSLIHSMKFVGEYADLGQITLDQSWTQYMDDLEYQKYSWKITYSMVLNDIYRGLDYPQIIDITYSDDVDHSKTRTTGGLFGEGDNLAIFLYDKQGNMQVHEFFYTDPIMFTHEEIAKYASIKNITMDGVDLPFKYNNIYMNFSEGEDTKEMHFDLTVQLEEDYYEMLFADEEIPLEFEFIKGTNLLAKYDITKNNASIRVSTNGNERQNYQITFTSSDLNAPKSIIESIDVANRYGCSQYRVDKNGNYIWEVQYGNNGFNEGEEEIDLDDVVVRLNPDYKLFDKTKDEEIQRSIGKAMPKQTTQFIVTGKDGKEQTHIINLKCNNVEAIYNSTFFKGISLKPDKTKGTAFENAKIAFDHCEISDKETTIRYSVIIDANAYASLVNPLYECIDLIDKNDYPANTEIEENGYLGKYGEYEININNNNDGNFKISIHTISSNDVWKISDIREIAFDGYNDVKVQRVNGDSGLAEGESLWVFNGGNNEDFKNEIKNNTNIQFSVKMTVKDDHGSGEKWIKNENQLYNSSNNTFKFTSNVSGNEEEKTIILKYIGDGNDYVKDIDRKYGNFDDIYLENKNKTVKNYFDESKYYTMGFSNPDEIYYKLNNESGKLTSSNSWYNADSVVYYRVYQGYVMNDNYDNAEINTVFNTVDSNTIMNKGDVYEYQFELAKGVEFYYEADCNTSSKINTNRTIYTAAGFVSQNDYDTVSLKYIKDNSEWFHSIDGNVINIYAQNISSPRTIFISFYGKELYINGEPTQVNENNTYEVALNNNEATIKIVGYYNTQEESTKDILTYTIKLSNDGNFKSIYPACIFSTDESIGFDDWGIYEKSYGSLLELRLFKDLGSFDNLPKVNYFKLFENDDLYYYDSTNLKYKKFNSLSDYDGYFEVEYYISEDAGKTWYSINGYQYSNVNIFDDEVVFKMSIKQTDTTKIYVSHNGGTTVNEADIRIKNTYFKFKESESINRVSYSNLSLKNNDSIATKMIASGKMDKTIYYTDGEHNVARNKTDLLVLKDEYKDTNTFDLSFDLYGKKVVATKLNGSAFNCFQNGTSNIYINETASPRTNVVIEDVNLTCGETYIFKLYSYNEKGQDILAIRLAKDNCYALSIETNPVIYGSGPVNRNKIPMPVFTCTNLYPAQSATSSIEPLYNGDFYYTRDDSDYRQITLKDKMWIDVYYNMNLQGNSYNLVYGNQGYKTGAYDVDVQYNNDVQFFHKYGNEYHKIDLAIPQNLHDQNKFLYVRYADTSNVNNNSNYLNSSIESYKKSEVLDYLQALYKDNKDLFVGDKAKAVFSPNTEFVFEDKENKKQIKLTDANSVSLLFDNLKEEELTEVRSITSQNNSNLKYLNLVYGDNGNMVVEAVGGCIVYWPYPKASEKTGEFTLNHLKGLDRTSQENSDKQFDGTANPVTEKIYEGENGIIFYLAQSNFSPLELSFEPHEHFIVPVAKQNPTCTSVGYEAHYKCSKCETLFSDGAGVNEIKLEDIEIEKIEHDFSGTPVTITPASCTQNEIVRYTCVGCKEATKDVEIKGSKLQHEFKLVDEESYDSTCYSTGLEVWKCKTCNNKKYLSVPVKEHHFVFVEEIPATQDAHGTMAHYECDVCANNNKKTYYLECDDGAFIWDDEEENMFHYLLIHNEDENHDCTVCHEHLVPEYNIVFNPNGGTGTIDRLVWMDCEVDELTEEFIITYRLPSEVYEKIGYNFVCWKDADGNEYQRGGIYKFSKDTELVAQWQIKVFKVVVDGVELNVSYGDNLSNIPTPTRDGCTFDGWEKDGVDYDMSTPITGPIVVNSKWKTTINDPEQIEGKDLSGVEVKNSSQETIMIKTENGFTIIPKDKTVLVENNANQLHAKVGNIDALQELAIDLAVNETDVVCVNLVVKSEDNTSIDTEDKNLVIGQLGNDETLTDFNNPLYLDIKLMKNINGSEGPVETTLNKYLNVVAKLPNTMINKNYSYNRIYKAIHVKSDTTVEVIDCIYNDADKTITIPTKEYSTYAIVYKDVRKTVDHGDRYYAPLTGIK